MVDMRSKRCSHGGCSKWPYFGVAGTRASKYCRQHAVDGMVDVRSKRCAHRDCSKRPSFGVTGTRAAEYCAQHAVDGMVDVLSKRCAHGGCSKRPSFGVTGTRAAEYCAQHAKDGMVGVFSKRCAQGDCSKWPSFGVAGTRAAEYCLQHAVDGMVNVRVKNCAHGGSSQPASHILADARIDEVGEDISTEYGCECSNSPNRRAGGCNIHGSFAHNVKEETMITTCPTGAKRKIVNPLAARKTLSGSMKDSRKQARKSDTIAPATSTAGGRESNRANRSCRKRNTSVKTEVFTPF